MLDTLIKEIVDTHSKVIPLEYIIMVLHYSDDLNTKGTTVRLEGGGKVKITDGQLQCMEIPELPTHIVTSCQGTYSGLSLSVCVMDLNTQELSEINL